MVLQDITNVPQVNYDSPNYSDSDSYDSDTDYEERPKRCLGLCILWCDDIHGSSAGSDINNHYAVVGEGDYG